MESIAGIYSTKEIALAVFILWIQKAQYVTYYSKSTKTNTGHIQQKREYGRIEFTDCSLSNEKG